MYPRQAGTVWKIQTPAKLNLLLEVHGRRPDGFHDLETLMVPVRLWDDLSYTPFAQTESNSQAALHLRVHPLSQGIGKGQLLGDNDDNLVVRAARLLFARAGTEPHGQFELNKRIPIQAGMGGGSSNAAATLLLVNAACEFGYTIEHLQPLAAELGSDVPFFLTARSAVCRGRGEFVETINGLPKLHFVVAKPTAGFSTAKVFDRPRAVSQPGQESFSDSQSYVERLLDALRRGALSHAAKYMTNRLEAAAITIAPWLAHLKSCFEKTGCFAHFLTGSGSAYVGLTRSAKQARSIANQLANIQTSEGWDLGRVFATSSC